jgi:hypothetical protein
VSSAGAQGLGGLGGVVPGGSAMDDKSKRPRRTRQGRMTAAYDNVSDLIFPPQL